MDERARRSAVAVSFGSTAFAMVSTFAARSRREYDSGAADESFVQSSFAKAVTCSALAVESATSTIWPRGKRVNIVKSWNRTSFSVAKGQYGLARNRE